MTFFQRIGFRLFVWWQIVRQWILTLWYFAKSFRRGQPHPWGLSAPSWHYPTKGGRALKTRMLKAMDDCRDCTDSLVNAVANSERPDLFYQTLEHLEYDGPLTCKYKDGMRAFYVTYRDMVVFPPSVSQTETNPIRQVWSTLMSVTLVFYKDEECRDVCLYANVSDTWKRFGGPAMDFYMGSAYESRPCDVFSHWITENKAPSEYAILVLVFNGYEMTVDVHCETPICQLDVVR